MRTSVQRGGLGLMGILLIVAGLAALSARTGGPVSWHVTAGSSMQPDVQPGALVVVARKTAYAVGDVVAYPSAELGGQVVLHRVVGLERHGRMVLQGDANTWLDPETPLPSEALGSRVFQLGGVGAFLGWLTQPTGMGAGAAMMALPFLGKERRRRRRSGPPGGYPHTTAGQSALPTSGPTWTDDPEPEPDLELPPARAGSAGGPAGSSSSSSAPGAVAAARAAAPPLPAWSRRRTLPGSVVVPRQVETGVAVLAGACVLLVAAGTAGPLLRSSSPSEPAQHVVTWSYGADVAPGLVYENGRVETGDTLYTRLVDAAEVTAELRVEVPPGTAVEGTWRLAVAVADDSGWKRTTSTGTAEPVRATPATGEPQRLGITVRIADLLALAQRAAVESGVEPNGRRVTVQAVLDLEATTAGQATAVRATPELVFLADKDKLRVAEDSVLEQHGDIGLPATDTSEVVQLAGVELPADGTRAMAAVGALLALTALGLLRLGRREEDEDARITRSAGQLLVPIEDLQEPERTVDVSSFEALAAIAASYDRMVLYGDHDGLRVYLVLDDGIAYRYYNADVAARLETAQAERAERAERDGRPGPAQVAPADATLSAAVPLGARGSAAASSAVAPASASAAGAVAVAPAPAAAPVPSPRAPAGAAEPVPTHPPAAARRRPSTAGPWVPSPRTDPTQRAPR